MTSWPRRFGVTAIVLSIASLSGCAFLGPATVEHRPDGTYKLTCPTTLPRCLGHAEEICRGNRYVVLRAADHHDYMGSQSTVGEAQFRSSEALIECGIRGKSFWGSEADPMAATEPPPSPPPAVPARACVPGTTQTCAGPAACRGGQACRADGGGFSPCDCGDNRGTADSTTSGLPVPVAPPAPAPSIP